MPLWCLAKPEVLQEASSVHRDAASGFAPRPDLAAVGHLALLSALLRGHDRRDLVEGCAGPIVDAILDPATALWLCRGIAAAAAMTRRLLPVVAAPAVGAAAGTLAITPRGIASLTGHTGASSAVDMAASQGRDKARVYPLLRLLVLTDSLQEADVTQTDHPSSLAPRPRATAGFVLTLVPALLGVRDRIDLVQGCLSPIVHPVLYEPAVVLFRDINLLHALRLPTALLGVTNDGDTTNRTPVLEGMRRCGRLACPGDCALPDQPGAPEPHCGRGNGSGEGEERDQQVRVALRRRRRRHLEGSGVPEPPAGQQRPPRCRRPVGLLNIHRRRQLRRMHPALTKDCVLVGAARDLSVAPSHGSRSHPSAAQAAGAADDLSIAGGPDHAW
mmetsp:Transcript_54389/g.142150  ORF Transcript_54389/g.142150 Transcript_54389/m.142150 type:complete len:387 (+) Transcript_54389:1918-3078(+)